MSKCIDPSPMAARFPWNGGAAVAAVLLLCASVSSSHAQCNCTCDPLVPSSQQINAVLMNESGGSPTHFVSAGGPAGVAREIRHGNLFGGSITITHVCIALQSPSGLPGEIANVQIYQPDPDPINVNLPGAMIYDQQFQVSPGFNNHQIVQLVTPQAMGANFWLVVAYPTAQPAIGHQGTRPRTQGNSAVFIHPPGAGTGWKYYDDLGGPGGTAGYLGNAPIIRPLNIGASTSACPYDQQCCATVCGIQPSCCSIWDPLCEQLALQNCFPNGCASCPPSGVSEGEACNTDANGGCDTNGIFSTLACDTIVCGSLWRHLTTGAMDTDWYVIDVVDLDGSGMSFLTITVESEVGVEVLLQNNLCPSDPLWVVYTGANAQACIPKVFGGAVPSPGQYRISVKAIGITGSCPQNSDYTLWVDVDDCPGANPPPTNDDCASAGSILLNPGAFTFDTTGATTDGPAEPCGFTGVNDGDVWMTLIAPCNGTASLTLSANFVPLLSAWTDCPLAGGVMIACGAGGGAGGPNAVISFSTIAGQVYIIRAGGLGGATGIATIDYDFQSCAADVAPQPFGDCAVNVQDLLAVITSWGACPPPCPRFCDADVNHDCTVNVVDLLAVIAGWGPCP
jgi:hypothetical protein